MQEKEQIDAIRTKLKASRQESIEHERRMNMAATLASQAMWNLRAKCLEAMQILYNNSEGDEMVGSLDDKKTVKVLVEKGSTKFVTINGLAISLNQNYTLNLVPNTIYGRHGDMPVDIHLPSQLFPRWQLRLSTLDGQWRVRDKANPDEEHPLTPAWILRFLCLRVVNEQKFKCASIRLRKRPSLE